MKKFKFHLYHISFLDDLFKGLEKSDASIENVVSKCQIKRFDLSSQETYLPIEVFYEFIKTVKYQYGIDHLASEFYGKFQLGDFGEFGEFLTHCPDLLSVIQNGIKYNYQAQTNGVLKLDVKGAVSRFSMTHKDPPSQSRIISEKIELAMMIKAFQFVLGQDWKPLALEVNTPDGQWAMDLLPSTEVNVNTNSPNMAIIFRTKEMANKNPGYQETSALEGKELLSASSAMNHVLNSMKMEYIPTIDDFSYFFGCSKRTILRSVMENGLTYREVLEKHLFLRSLELLQNFNLCVDEISNLLGYANAPNFIRAFKKWTNSTPHSYRKQELLATG